MPKTHTAATQAPTTQAPTTQALAQTSFFKGFVDHPASVNETYFQHARFAFGFSVRLFGAACAALIHAIVPPLFENTAGRMIDDLHARMKARH